MALDHAESEFEKYEETRRKIEATQPVSDFDKAVEKITKKLSKPKKKK